MKLTHCPAHPKAAVTTAVIVLRSVCKADTGSITITSQSNHAAYEPNAKPDKARDDEEQDQLMAFSGDESHNAPRPGKGGRDERADGSEKRSHCFTSNRYNL